MLCEFSNGENLLSSCFLTVKRVDVVIVMRLVMVMRSNAEGTHDRVLPVGDVRLPPHLTSRRWDFRCRGRTPRNPSRATLI